MKQRPLCQAENNTCKNLAENKGRARTGAIRYGRYCDGHRRAGHSAATVPTNQKRYVPLDACEMCLTAQATDRHRIISGGVYTHNNVVGLCKQCHKNIHRFYDRFRAGGFRLTVA